MTVRRLAVSALLVAANLVLAQGTPPKDQPVKDAAPAKKEPAKPAPGSLEDTLEKALRNSADIKAAEAKVREAEAELNRVRQQVLTKATSLHSDLNLAKRMLAVAEQTLATQERLIKQSVVQADGMLAAQAMVEKHRGEVEKLETELKSLRGEFALSLHSGVIRSVAFSPDGRLIAGTDPGGEVRIWDAVDGRALSGREAALWSMAFTPKAPAVQAPMAERIRKFLETEVSFQDVLKEARGDFALGNLMDGLLKATKADIPIHKLSTAVDAQCKIDPEVKGTLPAGAMLQLFEDNASEVRIVVRDYGLLVTTKDRVPEGAMRAVDFWKGKETRPKEDKKGPEKK